MYKTRYKIKLLYHLNFWIYYLLSKFSIEKLKGNLRSFSLLNNLRAEEMVRVNYYNKLESIFYVNSDVNLLSFFISKVNSSYFYDFYRVMNGLFNKIYFYYLFGDVRNVPTVPTFVKSRPICKENVNSVILPLDVARHFIFYPDNNYYDEKIPKIVWRGAVHKDHRLSFIKSVSNLPFCNVGATSNSSKSKIDKIFIKNWMSIKEQLQYKFIFSIEGNDVATNLKWIMNSNSLCFMPKPKYETWFMEGRLIPNFHYVLIKDDFSDVKEKYEFYIKNPELAKKIIQNANSYCKKFYDIKREMLIAKAVVLKYAQLSKQI